MEDEGHPRYPQVVERGTIESRPRSLLRCLFPLTQHFLQRSESSALGRRPHGEPRIHGAPREGGAWGKVGVGSKSVGVSRVQVERKVGGWLEGMDTETGYD